MAIPTQPTLSNLVAWGYADVGISSPTATQTTTGERWIEEVKNDIWSHALELKIKLKPLFVTSYAVTVDGKSRYALPSDCDSILNITSLTYDHSGTLTGAAAGSATLAADEDITDDSILGKLILLSTGVCSQVTAYNETTKVATVTPNFSSTPAGTESYYIISGYNPLFKKNIKERDNLSDPTDMDEPEYFYSVGNAGGDSDETGEFELSPIPDDVYGIQLRYYVSLPLLDLTSNILKTLYRRWQNVFVQGVITKAFRSAVDDNRYQLELQKYTLMIDNLMYSEADSSISDEMDEVYYY